MQLNEFFVALATKLYACFRQVFNVLDGRNFSVLPEFERFSIYASEF